MVDLGEYARLYHSYMETLNQIAAFGYTDYRKAMQHRLEGQLALVVPTLLRELREAREKIANWQRWTDEGIDGIRKLGRDGAFDSLLPGTHGAEVSGDD